MPALEMPCLGTSCQLIKHPRGFTIAIRSDVLAQPTPASQATAGSSILFTAHVQQW
jgi:hypothetical protein